MLAFILPMLTLLMSVWSSPVSPPSDLNKRDDVMCYDRCWGIDRARAIDGMDWFCQKYAGTHLYYNIDEGLLAVSDNYTYEPALHVAPTPLLEEGIIWMSMGFYFDGPDKSEWCSQFFTGYDIIVGHCYWGIVSAIDRCNTGGENHKQGGRWRSECFQFYFDPNPIQPCTHA